MIPPLTALQTVGTIGSLVGSGANHRGVHPQYDVKCARLQAPRDHPGRAHLSAYIAAIRQLAAVRVVLEHANAARAGLGR